MGSRAFKIVGSREPSSLTSSLPLSAKVETPTALPIKLLAYAFSNCRNGLNGSKFSWISTWASSEGKGGEGGPERGPLAGGKDESL